jgi:hypothetical protein
MPSAELRTLSHLNSDPLLTCHRLLSGGVKEYQLQEGKNEIHFIEQIHDIR